MARDFSTDSTPAFATGGRFDTVVSHVLSIEGGDVLVAVDHGGETQFGISLRFLKAEGRIDADRDGFQDGLSREYDLDFDGDIDGADVRALSVADAKNLYYRCFWRRLDLDNVPLHVDSALFDQAVNCGIFAAVKLLQRSLNRMVLMSGDLKVDGDFGRQTKARLGCAIRKANGIDDLLVKFRQEAAAHYVNIIRADHSQVVFQAGWLKRAEGLGRV